MSANGKDHSSGDGKISPEDREAIRQRSAEIGQKLDALKSRRPPTGGSPGKTPQSDYGPAFQFAAELVVGVVVGGGLGWVLDRQFGTAPWLMIVLVILGFAAGLLSVVRAARKAQAANEPQQRAAPSVNDDDE
jgi:ATP synthase protein I